MVACLLERGEQLQLLDDALAAAIEGRGSVVVIAGEAGIGKTSLVRAFRRRVSGRASVLVGACDDLLAPRALGCLHDAAHGVPGPLATALADGDREAVFAAVLDQLAMPSVLVVEDAHWADDASLDVLRHLGRRIADLPAVLVLTYRDDEVGREHPLVRLLGGLAGGPVRRVDLPALSRAAVEEMAGGADAAALHRLTGGNPFHVTEVLAAGTDAVPATVADAVLARMNRLGTDARHALEHLCVVPSGTELGLARALLPDLTVLAEAERVGMLEVAPHQVRFRHELARRAVEGALPVTRRMQLHTAVLAVLRAQDPPEPARIVHHAVQAADAEAVLAHAPAAADEAARRGAGSQAAALYEAALAQDGLDLPRRAELSELLAQVLFNADRRQDAVAAAAGAVELREQLADPVRLGRALATLALQQWGDMQVDAALASARRAVDLLQRGPDTPELAFALVQLAIVLVNVDRDEEALASVEAGLAVEERLVGARVRVRGRIYRGRIRAQLGDEDGLAEIRAAQQDALDADRGDEVLLGYLNLAASLWRCGRYAELDECLAAAEVYARPRDVPTGTLAIRAIGHRLRALRGEWAAAEAGLRWAVDGVDDHGMLGRQALPTLASLALRQGRPDAEKLLDKARENATRSQNLFALVPVAATEAESGWLSGDPRRGDLARAVLPRLASRGRERDRGELTRWLHRLGDPVETFEGCPPEYAAALRGDWRAAAAAWAAIGAPYERALELVDSGDPAAMGEALAVLDGLGAVPAAALTRARMRSAGVVPARGPQTATRADPAGLTARQREVLALMATDLTNAEIAAKLVLSVRTVDHHVSAILAKLGAGSRREAVSRDRG